jgi:Tol biopolymer transport system component
MGTLAWLAVGTLASVLAVPSVVSRVARGGRPRRSRLPVALLVCACVLAAAAQPAAAASPGRNGRLAWANSYENFFSGPVGDYDLIPTLFTSDADGGNRLRLAEVGLAPEFSPNGMSVAFTGFPGTTAEYDQAGAPTAPAVAAADGSGTAYLAVRGAAPAWSPDGAELVFEDGPSYYRPRRLAIVNMAGVVRPLAGTRRLDSQPDWGVNGSIAFVRREHIYVVRPGTGKPRRLMNLRAGTPDWSPDAKRLAFTRLGRTSDIWTVKPNGRGLRRVARNGSEPAWSPDGSAIAFTRRYSLWVMNADGRAQRRIVTGRYSSYSNEDEQSQDINTIHNADWQPLP